MASTSGANATLPRAAVQAQRVNLMVEWAFDPLATGGGTVMVAATQYFTKIPLPRDGMTVTNILSSLGTAGNTLTHSYVALYNSSGTMLSQSADQSANWVAGTVKTTALGAAQTVTPTQANDFVWVMFYVGTAVTPPTWRGTGVAANLANFGTTAATSRFASLALADTATMPNITPSSLTASAIENWCGIT